MIVVITTLFIISAVTPMAIGYNAIIPDEDAKLDVSKEPTAMNSDGLMDSAWPMYCHNTRHTGRSPYIPTGKIGVEKWRFRMEGITFSTSPVIDRNGTIYTGGGVYSLYAVNPDGTEKWRFEPNSWVETTPALAADGTIYFGCNDNKLYALNPNGTLKWKVNVGVGWVHGSPAIDDNGIIYTSSVNGQNICAIYPNGTKKWSYHTFGLVYCSPAIADDGTIYCGSNDFHMYALYPNGTLKWKYETFGYIQSAPAIGDDGTIYFGSWDTYLYALYPNGTLRWKYQTGRIDDSSPAIADDGTIYVGTIGPYSIGSVYSFNPDGAMNWKFETGDEIYSSPAVDANGVVYIGSQDGFLYALNFDGTLRWKFNTGDLIDSSPAIGEDGRIYFIAYNYQQESFSHLFAVEVREHAADLEIADIKYRLARFKVTFKNVGDVDASEVQWSIEVIEFGAQGLVNLRRDGIFETFAVGEEKKKLAFPLFGFGVIDIRISISAVEANPDYQRILRFIFGPLLLPIPT